MRRTGSTATPSPAREDRPQAASRSGLERGVRPGAAARKCADGKAHVTGRKSAPLTGGEAGWYRGRPSLSSLCHGDGGSFCLSPAETNPKGQECKPYEAAVGTAPRRSAGRHRAVRRRGGSGERQGPFPGQKGRADRRSPSDGQAQPGGAPGHGPAGQRGPRRHGEGHRRGPDRAGGRRHGAEAEERGRGRHRARRQGHSGPQAPHVYRPGRDQGHLRGHGLHRAGRAGGGAGGAEL